MTEMIEILHQRVIEKSNELFDNVISSLDKAAKVPGRKKARLSREFKRASEIFSEKKAAFNKLIEGREVLALHEVNDLVNLLPPENILIRYDLERMTKNYEEMIFATGKDLAELFIRGEAACDRGNYDIGINVIESVSKQNAFFFPAFLVNGFANLSAQGELDKAMICFTRALTNTPFQNADHYKAFMIQMIAHTHDASGRKVNAIQTLRQLRHMDYESTSITYQMARLRAQNGQQVDAMRNLESLLINHVELLFLALVDDNFEKIHKAIRDLLEEKTEVWGAMARNIVTKLQNLSAIARKYNLDANNDELDDLIQHADECSNILKNDTLSIYLEMMTSHLPKFVPKFPQFIIEDLSAIVNRETETIKEYNLSLVEDFNRKKKLILRIGIPSWVSFSLILSVVLFLLKVNSWTAGSAGFIFAILGFIPYGILESSFSQRQTIEKRHTQELMDMRNDLTEVHSTGNDIKALILREGL